MKIQLLLSISLALKLIHAEVTENTTHNEEHEITILPRSGVVSNIVGGLVKPLNILLSETKEVIVNPIKEVADSLKSNLKAIHPGTQWCGDGNRARSEEDLGLFKKTDDCCREHDNCPDNIRAGKSRHGLNNSGLFTRSNCDCDEKFYNCLKKANTLISKNIGVTYFNILRPKCFKNEYPVSGCEEYEGLLIKRCAKYEMDYSSPKIWQWFDPMEF